MNVVLSGSGAKTLEKALKELGKATQKSSADAVKIAIKQAGAFYMSFDDTESLPYVKGTDGMITVSGKGLAGDAGGAGDAGAVDEVLARQTQIAADALETQLQLGLKEFLT